MTENFEVTVHLYRTKELKKDDFSYFWKGMLPCSKIEKQNQEFIIIDDWTKFFDSFEKFKENKYIPSLEYYPCLFWEIKELNIIGCLDFDKVDRKTKKTLIG